MKPIKSIPKIIISGGGTGGHLYPALAIAKELRNRLKVDILFVGALGKIEMQKVPKAHFPIKGLWIGGLSKKWNIFLLPLKIIHSLWKARAIIRSFTPDLVIGTGGYASAPMMMMAYWYKIPILIQEQNALAGKVNRFMGRYAQKICVAYEKAKIYFPAHKTHLSGNPIRGDLLTIPSKIESCKQLGLDPLKPVILSLGGSQGAQSLNDFWKSHLKTLPDHHIQLIWQVGEKNYPLLKDLLKEVSSSILILPFIETMDIAYGAADIIISRAGALSLSELTIVGKPLILVPFPFASGDHQRKNAKALLDKKAALMLENHQIKEKLLEEILKLLKNEALREELSKNSKKFALPNALDEIIEECLKLIYPY